MTGYGDAFAAWRAAAQPDWDAYTRHPFVEGLRDGTLPQSCFLTYLVQDYLFLQNFSRAWALAIVKAGDLDEMRACSATVHTLLDHEMGLHVQTCARAGMGPEVLANAQEAVTNIAYTRYVLEAGYSGDFLDLLAALMPCVLGYGEIGLRLAQEVAPDTPYREWIDTYAGAEYQAACHSAGTLLDSAILKRLGPAPEQSPRWTKLSQRFATATRLEVSFWELGRE
ncbi:thiaminase II [Paracoccus methylovorus]|uniref:Aminopyrimidine aminohydrolase n=1 Tax=Paracoccus methylovorus TaxID=2812658 RepID=A0ABX7JID7_9RHOB|nr:thiaminase II [Paracoccus methylovorus]QRZ13023.1 thiaminase II [Paracoccus methylovorus]